MSTPIKLYRHPISGSCHRVELFLGLLGLPYERIEVDLLKGEQRQPAFRSKNRLGQVPVIEDGDITLFAPEGGISLEPYPALRAWHARIEALQGFVPMHRTTVPAVAQRSAS